MRLLDCSILQQASFGSEPQGRRQDGEQSRTINRTATDYLPIVLSMLIIHIITYIQPKTI